MRKASQGLKGIRAKVLTLIINRALQAHLIRIYSISDFTLMSTNNSKI